VGKLAGKLSSLSGSCQPHHSEGIGGKGGPTDIKAIHLNGPKRPQRGIDAPRRPKQIPQHARELLRLCRARELDVAARAPDAQQDLLTAPALARRDVARQVGAVQQPGCLGGHGGRLAAACGAEV